MTVSDPDVRFMTRALELAERGQGHVEPNPMVGCVIVRGQTVVGEGWHQRFGGPHAEVEALQAAGEAARGATLYVTLEPCCHHGKTPPCTAAIIAGQVARVVAAQRDPFPCVAGRGIQELQAAGIRVDLGLLEDRANSLNAPYRKLLAAGRPWIVAKWAMTLDGHTATRSGDSRWISNETSRAVGHRLRGRVDAVLVGRRTAALDDPLLTARPPGPRTAARIVLDSRASLADASQLVRTAREIPVLVVVNVGAVPTDLRRLEAAGCETFLAQGHTPGERVCALLDELGRRRMTNVLVEGGGTVLGAFLDADEIDELHVFIAPRLVGGAEGVRPIAGTGLATISAALAIENPTVELLDGDIYLRGRVARAR